MEKSSFYLEIFGNDIDSIAPEIHPRPIPPIPVIDEAPELRKQSDGSARLLCKRLETHAMIAKLCPLPESNVAATRILKTFEDAIKPQPDFVKHVLDLGSQRIARKSRIVEGAPRRRRELREIIDSTLGGFIADNYPVRVKADVDYHFGRIADAAERLTSEILIEATI